MMTIATITPQKLNELKQSGKPVDLIDVRTPVEFQEIHVTFARNVPLDRLNANQISQQRTDPTQPLYVICRSGKRGQQACEQLQQAGLTQIVNVEGGTQAWDAAGLPVSRGRAAISLERQVRIAAGALVLIGTLLGFFAHHYWLVVPAFVGAGLMFAGITDTCGMGMILARMPWNQVRTPSTPQPQQPTTTPAGCDTPTSRSCCS